MSCTPTIRSDLEHKHLSVSEPVFPRPGCLPWVSSQARAPLLWPLKWGHRGNDSRLADQVPFAVVWGNRKERRLSCNKRHSVKTTRTVHKRTTVAESIPDAIPAMLPNNNVQVTIAAPFSLFPPFLSHSQYPTSTRGQLDQTPRDEARSAVSTATFPVHTVGVKWVVVMEEATYLELSDLPHNRAHCSCCRTNQHCFSTLHSTDVKQAKVGC